MRKLVLVLALPIVLLPAAVAHAQEDAKDWRFVVQPYLMLPAMDGKVAVRGIDADVDVGRKDIINNLNIGFMGYLQAARGNLAFGVDINYANLDANPDSSRTSANVAQTLVQPMLFLRVTPELELMAGARYNSIALKLESDFPLLDGQEREQDWVDPIVGFRFTGALGASTYFSLSSNIGGFGIGSDLALQVTPVVRFAVSRTTSIDVGYSFLYMDYERGTGADRFEYDVMSQGPFLGLTFQF